MSAMISYGMELYRLEGARVLKFGVVGIVATLVHYTVATCFAELGDLSIVTANILGWLVGLVVSWYGHRHFTFSKAEFDRASPLMFTAISIFAIGISSGVAYVMHLLDAPAYIGLLFAIGIIPVITFLGHRFVVFHRKLPRAGWVE
jgi:putative flippase GtrA